MSKEEKLEEKDVLLRVGELVKEVRYGEISLIIQDGKVIQINKTEKIRL